MVGRPLNFTVRTHMPGSAKASRYRSVSAVFCAAAPFFSSVGCADDCAHSDGPAVRSPNGEWVAHSERTLCGGRALALGSDTTIVKLLRHKARYPDLEVTVLSAEGINTAELAIHWTSNYQLELTVPIHTDIATLIASYQGIDVAINFTPSNPNERARWVAYKRKLAEWTDQTIEWDERRSKDPATAGSPPQKPEWQPE